MAYKVHFIFCDWANCKCSLQGHVFITSPPTFFAQPAGPHYTPLVQSDKIKNIFCSNEPRIIFSYQTSTFNNTTLPKTQTKYLSGKTAICVFVLFFASRCSDSGKMLRDITRIQISLPHETRKSGTAPWQPAELIKTHSRPPAMCSTSMSRQFIFQACDLPARRPLYWHP